MSDRGPIDDVVELEWSVPPADGAFIPSLDQQLPSNCDWWMASRFILFQRPNKRVQIQFGDVGPCLKHDRR